MSLAISPSFHRGIKRLYSREQRPWLPIAPQILLHFKQHVHLHWHDHQLLWSAMLIAFFGFLCSSEILGLQVTTVPQPSQLQTQAISQILTSPSGRANPPRLSASCICKSYSVGLAKAISTVCPLGAKPIRITRKMIIIMWGESSLVASGVTI